MRSDSAASEVIGVLIIIGIVIAGLTIVGVMVFSQPLPEEIPAIKFTVVNLFDQNGVPRNVIRIVHDGGDPIPVEQLSFLLDDIPVPDSQINPSSDLFSFGEYIDIPTKGGKPKIGIVYSHNG